MSGESDHDDVRTAIAEALMIAKVNGSPVHEHLGDLMRAVMEYITPTLEDRDHTIEAEARQQGAQDAIAVLVTHDLEADGWQIVPTARAEDAAALARLPKDEDWTIDHVAGKGTETRMWHRKRSVTGPTLAAAIAAALEDGS